ncbi:MAG TPA: DUF378 domain-containing protein [Candidatus Binatia bacterium]|nr:DUF378 domain-containing protein [Candidatus Binatia bacterium]
MLKNACTMCKVVGAIAIIGALNWGMMALFHVNMVEQIVGMGMANWIYMLVGLAGVLLLVSFVYVCPGCRKMKPA